MPTISRRCAYAYTSRASATPLGALDVAKHSLAADREEVEVGEPERGSDEESENRGDDFARLDPDPRRADADRDECLPERDDHDEAVALREVRRVELPARRPAQRAADVSGCDRREPEPGARAVREARDEDQRRAQQRPRREAEHGGEQVAVPASREGVEREMHRDDDEEGCTEEHTLVVEHVRHYERRDEHRDQRDEQRRADDALLGVDGVRQPGVGRPHPPERGEHEHAAADPCERRVVGEQRRDLREREHEDEVEEELARRNAVLVLDGRDAHLSRPYSVRPIVHRRFPRSRMIWSCVRSCSGAGDERAPRRAPLG
jgi:hypothetical protein